MKELRSIIEKQPNAATASILESHDESEIVKLVDRAASGNLESFGELYSLFLDRIYRYVFYRVRNSMLAEDITEEVFIKAWKSIHSCKGKGRTFASWLYRIAHNQVVNVFRNRRKEGLSMETAVLAEACIAESGVEASLEGQELSELVAGLPHNQGQVIILKFFEGMNNLEIGRIMGKSQGAIRVLQMRALAKLRRKLGGDK